MFYVYYLQSKQKRNQYYTGYTEDLRERLKKHNDGLVPSTKPYRPWELVFYEAYKSQKDAKRREVYLKTTNGRKALKFMLRESLES
ncbi:MAG: GIY-YIG nuclease family protein [Candidatus Liptonbacteria bacterium]|nr:GIY-YIG nuclease family protein [Candidatus Liptonbacteria bacterium]